MRNRDLPRGIEVRLCPYCGLRGTAARGSMFGWPAWSNAGFNKDLWMRVPPEVLAGLS